MLFKNGVVLSTFKQLFFANDLGRCLLMVVFIHGTLEISAIVIAGAAGIILGNFIHFPKTLYPHTIFNGRRKRRRKIIISLLPAAVIVAAFFKGYVTALYRNAGNIEPADPVRLIVIHYSDILYGIPVLFSPHVAML